MFLESAKLLPEMNENRQAHAAMPFPVLTGRSQEHSLLAHKCTISNK